MVCSVQAPTACAEPAPAYADVAPIFEQNCVVCHSGQAGNWPLSTYSHVASWADEIRGVLLQCAMPPPDSGLRIEDAERDLLLAWIRCGLPR